MGEVISFLKVYEGCFRQGEYGTSDRLHCMAVNHWIQNLGEGALKVSNFAEV